MENPFKFGTIVDEDYFTDRVEEVAYIEQFVKSANHLVLISPRRFGKSSVVAKAVKQTGRKHITVNLQQATSVSDLSAKLLKEFFKVHPLERVRQLISHFRVIPMISTNPLTGSIDVSFQPGVDGVMLIEDVLTLIEKAHSEQDRMIVVLDEFQEIRDLAPNLDKQLRSIMQKQKNINYILLGSQESMMTDIFENKKSPFYHFGELMRLAKLPRDDFHQYLSDRLAGCYAENHAELADRILDYTSCHPYYTQQLASQVWELANYEGISSQVVETAVERLVNIHDLDFERLWIGFNRMDKRIMQSLCSQQNPLQNRQLPTSTTFSAIKRLMAAGYVIRTETYEVEDPFFKHWIVERQL